MIEARDARDSVSIALELNTNPTDANDTCQEYVLMRSREEIELDSLTKLSRADKIVLGDRIRSPVASLTFVSALENEKSQQ